MEDSFKQKLGLWPLPTQQGLEAFGHVLQYQQNPIFSGLWRTSKI